VDDCLFFDKDLKIINQFIAGMSREMPLTKELSVDDFWESRLKGKNKFQHTQQKLILQIIKAAPIEDCNAAKTPAENDALGSELDGVAFSETWEYASIVGMMMNLAISSRPDIAFATHQCARFIDVPRQILC
jgi:hypothetical protein